MLTLRERKVGTLALCFVAIAAVLFVVSLFIPALAEICEKNQYTGAKECPRYHIGPFILLLVWGFIEHHGELFTALATLAIAAFTFELKRSTDKLWKASDDQRRDTRSAIAANMRGARAAQKQAEIAEKALVDLERPYVFVLRLQMVGDPPKVGVEVTLHNYGRTPANIQEARVYVRILDHAPTADDEKPGPRASVEETEGIPLEIFIGEGKPHTLPRAGCREEFTNAVGAQMQQGVLHLYCWGVIEYRDIFKKTHPTYFCRRWQLNTSQWDLVGENGGY